jgi:hypothetical protein
MTAEIAPQDRRNARRFGSLMSFVELSARSGSRWCPLVTDAAGGVRRPRSSVWYWTPVERWPEPRYLLPPLHDS